MRIVVILLIFVISGCATLDHDHHHHGNRNSLSKAIETGTTGHSRRVHHDIDEGIALLEIVFDNEDPPSGNHQYKMVNEPCCRSDLSNIFSLDVSRSIDERNRIGDISRYSLIGGRREEYFSFLGHIAITDYDFRKDWRYYNDLENPWAIEAGLGLQFYFAGRKNFIQPFVKAGYSYGRMFWRYGNSIYDRHTGHEITRDSIEYSRPSAAFGIEFKISDTLDLSVDIQKDYTIYSGTTEKGFEEDILGNFGSTMFGTRLIWHF